MMEFGWNGLVPGQSTLDEAIERLGQPESYSALVGAECYHFCDGAIRITTPLNDRTISRIWISALMADIAGMPRTIEDARVKYGQIDIAAMPRIGKVVFARPGLTIACDSSKKPEAVVWIEFSDPLLQAIFSPDKL